MALSVRPPETISSRAGRGGFPLVELLVAAVLVLIAVAAVVAVVRTSTDLQINDFNNRQARAVIKQHFEQSFGYRSFSTQTPPQYSTTVLGPNNTETPVPFTVVEGNNHQFTPSIQIVLDDRAGVAAGGARATALPAYISFRGRAALEKISINGVEQEVPVHYITIRVTWTEVNGVEDAVQLTKRMANTYDR